MIREAVVPHLSCGKLLKKTRFKEKALKSKKEQNLNIFI